MVQNAETGAAEGYKLSSLEHHLYPAGVEHAKDKLTITGDSMSLYTQRHRGDVTLVAHLADITPDKASPDGTRPKDSAIGFPASSSGPIPIRDPANRWVARRFLSPHSWALPTDSPGTATAR